MKLTEVSSVDSKKQGYLVVALIIWVGMSIWEINGWISRGSMIGVAYIPFFLALMIWRCAFHYEVTLGEGSLTVTMSGLGFSRLWQVPVNDIKMLMPMQKRMLLRELGVSAYTHKYSSLDGNSMRVILFQPAGKKNPRALLFKASDSFYEKLARALKQQNPEIIIRTRENTR